MQPLRRIPAEAEISLLKIVQAKVTDRIQDPPITWFRLFEDEDDEGDDDEEPFSDDLTNPFAQDDHIPPIYPDLYPRRPEQGKDKQESESEGSR